MSERPNPTSRVGWTIVAVVAGVLVINGVALYTVIVDTDVERTIGVLVTAFGALALAVALEARRSPSAWAWRTGWIMVASLAALAAHTARADRLDVPLFYALLTVVTAIGVLRAPRSP